MTTATIRTSGGEVFNYSGTKQVIRIGEIFSNGEEIVEIISYANGIPHPDAALTEAGKYLQARNNWWEQHSKNDARHWCAKKDKF